MFKRLLRLPLEQKNSLFLFGPRGTGKTSWIRASMPHALYLDLLDFSVFSMLSSNPNRLETLIPPNFQEWVVIDEVQRVPELLNEVHRLIEGRGLKFLLTGSSARTLRRKGVNLLAGRALRYNMHPLVIQEIGQDFDVLNILHYGLLPATFGHSDPKKYLESYVQTYLREEVLQEGLTRNVGIFNRFLERASFSQGQVLNMSEIGRELGVNRLTVANYFEILEDLLLAFRLPVFSRRAKREVIAHQKIYYFDVGVYKTIRPVGLLDTPEEADGVLLETLFLQSLRAINDYFELGYNFYFWRTTSGLEVDFILYGSKGLHAFEIKRSSTVSSSSLKGLKAFGEEYPEATLTLIFLGKHKEFHDTIKIIPLIQALQELPNLLG